MRGPPSVSRTARFVLAALLAGSAGTSLSITARAATPGAGLDPSPAKPAIYDDDPNALPPSESGVPSDFRAPEKDEKPVTVAPSEPTQPLGPQEAAVLARLKEARPLLPRLLPKEREAMLAFYAIVDFKPAWIASGTFTPAATSVIARLQAAAEDGLDPAAYPVPAISPGMSEAETAEAELKLSAAIALYARDARGGRINLASISPLITPSLDLPSPDLVLGEIAVSETRAGERLQAYNPNQPGYLALKRRLAAGRDSSSATPHATPIRVPVGPVLKVGMRDARVPALRAHFGLPEREPGTLDAAPGEPDTYGQDLADAVAGFQRSHGLPDNGTLTRSTLVALALPEAPRARGGDEAELIANMERWRWLPRELGSDYILVNVPEYRLRVYRDGSIRDETRVVVGRNDTPTPLFSGAMEYAVVNPYWYVPPSIQKTMRGTGGFEVVGHGKTQGLRQPPGPKNALGYIKFLFPNRHAVYLHDTPARHLFSASQRAFSHGCVRVDNPFKLADAVLPDAWTQDKLTRLIGKGERTIRLDRKLPVHIAYFTAYIDDGGAYRTIPDVYGYDARIKTALGLPTTGGQLAALPPEPPRETVKIAAPAPMPAVTRTARGAQPAHPTRAAGDGRAARLQRREAVDQAMPVRHAQRARRSLGQEYGYGEPGLWTPSPQPVSRSWW